MKTNDGTLTYRLQEAREYAALISCCRRTRGRCASSSSYLIGVFYSSVCQSASTLSASFDLQTITTLYNMHYLSRAFCLRSILSGGIAGTAATTRALGTHPSVCVGLSAPQMSEEWHECFYMLRNWTRFYPNRAGVKPVLAPDRIDGNQKQREIISV